MKFIIMMLLAVSAVAQEPGSIDYRFCKTFTIQPTPDQNGVTQSCGAHYTITAFSCFNEPGSTPCALYGTGEGDTLTVYNLPVGDNQATMKCCLVVTESKER